MGDYFLIPDDVEKFAADMQGKISSHALGEHGPVIVQNLDGTQSVYEGPATNPGLIEATIETCKKFLFENAHKLNPLGHERMRDSAVELLDNGTGEINDRLREQGYDLSSMSVEELEEFKGRIVGGAISAAGSELGERLQWGQISEEQALSMGQDIEQAIQAFSNHIDGIIAQKKAEPDNNFDQGPGPEDTQIAATTVVPEHDQAIVHTGPAALAAVAEFDFSGDGATFSGNDPGLATNLSHIIPVQPDFLPPSAPTADPNANLESSGPQTSALSL